MRARVAELEAVASMAGPARRCEAAQLDLASASEPVRQRLEQQRTTILRLEALVERQAKALDATDADGAATEELLDRLARALRGVADLGDGAAPYHTEESKATPPKKLQASLLRTVEALRGRADASKRERRDAALGLDSDAARDRRAARAPIPPRALAPAPAPSTPEPSTPESARTPSPPSNLPGDSRPAWDDAFASDFIEETPPPAPAPSKRPSKPRPEWKGDF